ncbi:MAG: YiiX family permuted papain-like enzyme [Flavobacteriales bacterium]
MNFLYILLLLISHGLIGNKELKKQTGSLHKIKLLKAGDIVFQSTNSRQCDAIKLATLSNFSHCGIIETVNDEVYVIEAVQPVRIVRFDDWIKQNDSSYFEVKRLKDSLGINDNQFREITAWAKSQIGKNYDLKFLWSDDQIYCSELVFKAYSKGGNIALCIPKPLKSYSLNHPQVQQILKERYGSQIPWEETMVSPEDIYKSPLLYSPLR